MRRFYWSAATDGTSFNAGTATKSGVDTQPETVARAFLEALNESRWEDAASLVASATRQAFRAWMIEALRREERDPPPDSPSDTVFLTAGALLGDRSGAGAEGLSDIAVLARFAAAVQPQSLLDRSGKTTGPPIQVVRTLTGTAEPDGDKVLLLYRTDWYEGAHRADAMGTTNELHLTRTSEGWRVRDASLGGFGHGRILPPAEALGWAEPE